ncbi:P-loop containing nucleoside triphosphate hydrolase protein, partial [Mycena sp. CBHHK59/15]
FLCSTQHWCYWTYYAACFTSPSYHRLPPPSRIFHGRRNILNQMHDYFAWDVGKRHICLLHGLGGSGKTQIALKFLDESTASRFTDIFFIDASTPETINSGLENIAVTRSVGSKPEDASCWLAAHHEEWLLVFDNADNLNLNLHQFFPQSTCGNILITSRNPQLCVHAPGAHHQVSNMEEEDAVQLLLTSSAQDVTSENQILATEIVKVLHCLPLAVVQAGAFISKTGALGRYLTLYEQNCTRLLSELPAQSHDKYAWSVYTTWDISFQCLSKPAARFLQLCSFLHHEGISEAIFSHAASYELELLGPSEEQLREAQGFLAHFLTDSGAWDSLCFADMAAEIRGYLLINQDPQTNLFSIHPLVHHWCQTTNSDLHSTRECTAAIIGMSAFHSTDLFRIRLLPHLNFVMLPYPLLAHEFSHCYARVYYDSGQFHNSAELQVLMLEKSEQILGMEHPATLEAMGNLAVTYRQLGKFKDAEKLHVAVLEKREQVWAQSILIL